MGKRAPETNLLIAALKRCYEEKKTATYEDLEQIIAGCATANRNYLTSALNVVKADYGYLFKCIPTVGYKPVPNDSKVIEIERRRLQKIHSQVNKFEDELNCVNVTELPKLEQQRYYSAEIKLSCHKMILDERLNDTYTIAGQKCVNAGKIEFNLGDFHEAFKALN